MELNKLSSEYVENKMVTFIYDTLSFEDCFDTNLHAKFDKSDQFFEQPEEELMNFIEK